MKNSYILSFWKANSTEFEFLITKKQEDASNFHCEASTCQTNSKNINYQPNNF